MNTGDLVVTAPLEQAFFIEGSDGNATYTVRLRPHIRFSGPDIHLYPL
jgi:hypothetical protein